MTDAEVQTLRQFAERLVPRILTRACRDPRAVAYGCFDRDWWHYKTRDFPSIILQQGAYSLWLAAEAGIAPGEVRGMCAGACRFWNARAVKWGAFEEYYPWERGYPPLAFSTLAVAMLAGAGAVNAGEIERGLRVAARQIKRRFEARAGNQQVAGLAAAAWIRKVSPSLVDEDELEALKSRTLALQTKEGWFPEYGGPDLGYLSVTIDCLWHAYDATGDPDYLAAASKALTYIAPFVAMPSRGAGMHNARNTDYILPGGISRFIEAGDGIAKTAAFVLERTWGNLSDSAHFAHAIDDRYWSHYAGTSVMIAVLTLAESPPVQGESPTFEKLDLEESGQLLIRDSRVSLIVSPNKGGIFHAWQGDSEAADLGWTISDGRQQWVTHRWDDFRQSSREGHCLRIEGFAALYRETTSSPFKHLVLRACSLLIGQRLISSLKNRLIFHGAGRGGIHCVRELRWGDGTVEVTDTFTGMPARCSITRAPRSSLRHVASADSFQREDLALVRGWIREQTVRHEGDRCTVKTIYSVGSEKQEAAIQ